MAAGASAGGFDDDEKYCFVLAMTCIEEEEPEELGDYVKNELLLSFSKDFPRDIVDKVLREYGLTTVNSNYIEGLGLTVELAETNGQDPVELRKKINKAYEEIKAILNSEYEINAIASVGNPSVSSQGTYPKSLTGANRALKYARGEGVLIGMIDGPVDTKHRDLKHNVRQETLVTFNPKSVAEMHHGSMIAGVLVGQNERIGIAPKAKVLSISAFSFDTQGKSSSSSAKIVEAIDIAIKEKVDILNLSFSGSNKDPLVKRMIQKAVDSGILVVSSCGNNSSEKQHFPAAYDDVMAVTAVDHLSLQFPKANRGDYIDVAAPGVGILTTAPGDRYDFATGTSVAAAHVSGSLALLLSKNRKIKPKLLIDTTKDLGKPGYDISYGNGLINVLDALQRVSKNN